MTGENKPFDFNEQNRKLLASSIENNFNLKREIKNLQRQIGMIKHCIRELYEMVKDGNR